jgi:hypothetical protein
MRKPPTDDAPATFADVLAHERATIVSRREQAGSTLQADNPAGIALSGGGIRSATFCLGVLQELNARGLLKAFDYLSTVSGGGYVGGWWSAFLARPDHGVAFPPPRSGAPERESRPIHHLRLHSNYLIPHLGTFSWDTWRAITVIGRNLILTWLVLLPFVLAGMTVSQLYFLAKQPELVTHAQTITATVLGEWWAASSPIVAGMLTALGALTFVWLRQHRRVTADAAVRPALPALGWWAAMLMIATLVVVYARSDNGYTMPGVDAFGDEPERTIAICLALALVALIGRRLSNPNGDTHDPDLHRNNIAIVQQLFVMAFGVAIVLLVAGGLGHLLVGSVVAAAESWAAKAGGLASLILTGAGAGWTAFRKAGIGDGSSTKITRLLMRIAPTLLVVMLCALFASLSQTLITYSQRTPMLFHALVLVSFYGIVLAWVYASYETSWSDLFVRRRVSLFLPFAFGFAAGVVLYVGDAAPIAGTAMRYAPVALAVVCLFTIARRLGGVLVTGDERTHVDTRAGRMRLEAIILGLFAVGATIGRVFATGFDGVLPANAAARAGAVAVTFTVGYALVIRRYGAGQRRKGMYLLLYAGVVSALWLIVARGEWSSARTPLIDAFALLTATATWTLAFGWAVDPNNLALHAFYKARLVRAYMGASNALRHRRGSLIDDSVPGDDVLLTALNNAASGAPYHIVNATLNLAGDQSLGSLQRLAAPFIFSREYCGSPHSSCGFRPTAGYMGGGLTIGTSVAISGAAASPEMGSQTPSGAMSMLMTLFNVRLGFWAPMPGNASWRSRAARFWAFYTLREFLARTGDTASYGFLSDGGHFDNTAVYSLVARGTRLIVAADCGADPLRIFEDYGNLIRRCRIDFGAEISLKVDELRESPPDSLARAAYVVGTIEYSPQYLVDIGDPAPTNTKGYLLVVKPSLIGVEPLDVRQYRAANPMFPQQSTTDQFFDEAQFESYRRLGMCCAESALDALSASRPPVDAGTIAAAVQDFSDRRAKQIVVQSLNAGMTSA